MCEAPAGVGMPREMSMSSRVGGVVRCAGKTVIGECVERRGDKVLTEERASTRKTSASTKVVEESRTRIVSRCGKKWDIVAAIHLM